jgi:hypothetical protein
MPGTLTRNDQVAWDAVPEAVEYEATLKDDAGAVLNGPTTVVVPKIAGVDLAGPVDQIGNTRIEVISVDANGLRSAPATLLGVTLNLAPATPSNIRIEPLS